MTDIEEKAKLAGFSYEEIESIKKGLNDVEKGNTLTETEFYNGLEKEIFSQKKAHV